MLLLKNFCSSVRTGILQRVEILGSCLPRSARNGRISPNEPQFQRYFGGYSEAIGMNKTIGKRSWLGSLDIRAIELDAKSRDDIPAFLFGLHDEHIPGRLVRLSRDRLTDAHADAAHA